MIRIIKGDNAIMKKSVLSVLLAAILILSLCAACGQSAQTEAPVAESETFERTTPAPRQLHLSSVGAKSSRHVADAAQPSTLQKQAGDAGIRTDTNKVTPH